MAFSSKSVNTSIIVFVAAFVIVSIFTQLFPQILTLIHNFSDAMVTFYTSTVPIPILTTLFGYVDSWVGYITLGIVVSGMITLVVSFGSKLASGIKGYRRNRGYRRSYRRRY